MKKILCLVGLLLLSMTIDASYKVGALDTAANGGPGYGTGGILLTGGSTSVFNSVAVLPDGGSLGVGLEGTFSSGSVLLGQCSSNGTLLWQARGYNAGYGGSTANGSISCPNNTAIIVGQSGATNLMSRATIFIVKVKLGNSDPVTFDTSFGGGDGFITQNLTGTSQDVAYAVLVDSTGLIYVIGTSTQGGQGNIFVARYTSAGVLDTTFNSTGVTSGGGGKTTIPGIALISISTDTLAGYAACFDQDGKIVVAGSTTASTSMLIARITVGTGAGSGILDTTFDTDGYNILNLGGTDVAYGIAMQSTGKFVVAGTDGTNCAVARFTTTGMLDTTFGIASSGYNIINRFGGTAANAKGLVIQSDDKIVIGGNVTNSFSRFVIARYLADGSALDIGNFGATSADGYTVTDVSGSGIANTCTSIAIQQNGSFVLGGYYNNGIGTGSPVIARYLGTQNVQGAIDFSYQNTQTYQGFKLYPTDSTATNQPKVTAIYPAASSSLYVLSSATNTSTNSKLIKLSATGAAATSQVTIAQPTPIDVITDSNDKAVTIGNTITPKGYIARYYNNAGTMALDPTFNGGSISVQTTNSTSFRRVCQQSTGRYVVIGQAATSANGLLIGYTSAGVLDTTFGTSSSGFITMTTATFYDLIVDSNNFMYVAFSNDTNLCLAKYLADGSGLVSSFGTSGIINTGLPIANYSTGVCLSFDNNGNIVVCAANATTSGIALQRYAPTATTTASTTTIAATASLLSTPVITKIQCDTNDRIIFNGYENNQMFIGRCTSGTFSLDTSFGPYASCPGILKSMYTTINYANNLVLTVPSCFSNTVCINSNGNILCGGYESQNSSRTVSFVGQVTGYTSGTVYTQVRRFPRIPSVPGILNVDIGSNGALNLNTAPASLSAGQARAMYTLASGKILVADSNGTSTSLALLNTSYALDTASFGSGTGAVSLATMAQATTMMIDTSGNIYVVGTTSGGAVVVYKVPSNGASASVITIPAASASAGLTSAYDIVEQASGRILIAGYNSSYTGGASGVIMAYNPVADAVDTSFNPTGSYPGYWFTGVSNPVSAIAIGNVAAYKDKIYFAYENGSSAAVVARLLSNGTALDSTFSFGTAIASVSDETQIKMQLDVNGKIILVANTGTVAGVRAARYTANGANDVASATKIGYVSGQILQKVLAMSDGTTLILAAIPNATATSAYISFARLTSAGFILDTTFNPSGSVPGILTTNVPSSSNTPVMKDFYTFDTILAGGFLIAGDNSQTAATAYPYFAGIENTTAPTKVSQSATSTPVAGTLDTTCNPAGTTPGFINFAVELQTTDFPTATRITSFLQQSNGTYFVGGSTGSNSYVTLMSDDDVQNSSFGTSGLLTISGKTDLAAMLLAQSGALLVVGGTGTGGWVRSYNVSTGAATAGFSVSTTFANYYAVAQQTMGRILVAGSSSGGVGKMIAYNSVTGAVDTTFADNGIYTATGYGAIQSMIVDSLDNIYIIANDASNNAKVMCLNSSGTAINWTTTFIATTSTVSANNHLAFNQAGNIVAVGVNTTTPSIVVNTFTPGFAGGTAGTALTLAVGATGITTPNVTSLLVDLNASPGKVIVTGYDTNTDPSTPFVMRINSAITALDTTFNTTGVQSYNTLTSGVTSNWYTGMINADGKITVGGYASALTTPYLMRVYGDEFIGQYAPTVTAGTSGSINTTFGTSGELLLAEISGAGALAGQTPQTILTTTTGQYYITFADGSLVRLTNGGALDTTFNTTGFADSTPAGNSSIIIDGSNSLVLAGTDAGAGWVKRYLPNSGSLDTTFNSNIATALSTLNCISATTIVEQTLGRYIVAGTKFGGNGAIFAFTSTGTLDITFNNPITTGGWYDTGVANGVYALTVDLYDRIIIAYKNGSNIDVIRLTSAGQLDTQFNTTGIVTGAITGADDSSQVRIVLDQAGNIIVAAHTTTGISVRGLTTTGASLYAQLDIATVITNTPVLNDMIATSDGNILLAGSQSGANPMWVTRVTVAGALDTTFGGGDGIMTFSFDAAGTVTGRSLNSITMYPDGQIALVGTETNSANTPTVTPFLSVAYSAPYISQVSQSQLSQSQGINDTTLGASSTTTTNLGVTFFASAAGDATSGQVARAIALQDDANILVAVDGGLSSGSTTPSDIYLKMFNIDGVANTSFGTSGQRTVLTTYQNQNVQDMVTFTTVAGIHKAILAGYVTNTTFGTTSSLLLQYNLDTHALDTTFGGFDGNPSGLAFGDGKQINVVGQQSTGRIIGSGISNDTLGLILGYTSQGKLDASFGSNGYLVQSQSTGIYTHAIDSLNRIIIGWMDIYGQVNVSRFLADGSGFDTSFNTTGTINTLQTTYSNSGMKVAVDSSNNVFVAAVADNYTSVTIYAYDTTGTTLYTAFTPALSLTTFNITQLIVDTTGLVYVIGYDTDSSDQIVIARILANLSALDTTFNLSGVIPGCLKYAVAGGTNQAATDALIHPDGRILVVGSQI